MKRMDFFAGQGARRRHSSAYGNDEQRRHAKKDAVSCFDICEADHQATPALEILKPGESDYHVAMLNITLAVC